MRTESEIREAIEVLCRDAVVRPEVVYLNAFMVAVLEWALDTEMGRHFARRLAELKAMQTLLPDPPSPTSPPPGTGSPSSPPAG